MYAHSNPKTKEELIRQVETGEGVYAKKEPQDEYIHNGEAYIYGSFSWVARVKLKDGQIVKVLS